jgi:uncharacterized membrane protein
MKKEDLAYWLSRHWILIVSILFGIYAMTPFMAPVFMHIGWTLPARAIYFIYSFLCHQLPERSYFLFSPTLSHSLKEIQSAWQNTSNPAILRQFTGSAQMGWKVAWSDRMVSMFTSLWVFGMLWGAFRKRPRSLPWWGLALLLLPMEVDGITHLVSDFAGIGQGFRDQNLWLRVITHNALAPSFYAGDAWGSFNAWMRLITGFLFGFGAVWFVFPYLENIFADYPRLIERKLKRSPDLPSKALP